MRWGLRPVMPLASDLLRGTSDLLRLLARTTHLQFNRRDLVRLPRLAVHCSHLCNYALEIAPDHASGKGPAGGYFGFATTSGPDESTSIRSLGRGPATTVGGSLFAYVPLCVGDGARSCVCRKTCWGVHRICSDFWRGPIKINCIV